MNPPKKIDVIDSHGGFTIESEPPPSRLKHHSHFNLTERRTLHIGDTLWQPGRVLERGTTGKLVSYDNDSFYQTNNDVTIAMYRVPGYDYPVLIWFDNTTGKRIA